MNIFAKGQGAFIKVISLAIGLTVGLVLIAKERHSKRSECLFIAHNCPSDCSTLLLIRCKPSSDRSTFILHPLQPCLHAQSGSVASITKQPPSAICLKIIRQSV